MKRAGGNGWGQGLVVTAVVLAAAALGWGPPEGKTDRYAAALASSVAALRHTAAERGWERIPWTTDLAAAREAARRERRPIFLWVAGDDPLGRC